jgi:hypothetical protein
MKTYVTYLIISVNVFFFFLPWISLKELQLSSPILSSPKLFILRFHTLKNYTSSVSVKKTNFFSIDQTAFYLFIQLTPIIQIDRFPLNFWGLFFQGRLPNHPMEKYRL